jgi:LDH2 family malate/lactate/ureidoglycolate dehydrogenase
MVESGPLPEGTVRFPHEVIHEFIYTAFRSMDVPEEHARLVADVLNSADLRGIRSHGAGRLTYLLVRLENGVLNKSPNMVFTPGSDTTGVLDADNALGIVASDRAMDEALDRAEKHGTGFVAVRNSSHFGYCGYWSMKAMKRGFIGFSMTNGGRRGTATYGIEPIFGTNPFSVGIPGGPGGHDFHLDMATSIVAVGKIETALREGREVPKQWIPSSYGTPHLNERSILTHDVPVLPLGGEGMEGGGHKGYGLSLMVELLCSILSGADLKDRIAGAAGDSRPSTGHFFGAIKIEGFRDTAAVFRQMAETFDYIRGTKKESGQDRIYIHGEPEAIAEEENRRTGIPITPAVLEQLQDVNNRLSLGFEI